jgi:hypothetical protein
MATTTRFESERAPCGRVVSGEHFGIRTTRA